MVDESLDTVRMKRLLDGVRGGDAESRNELVRVCQNRLEYLARGMLRRYPSVARWTDTGEVFANAALRLLRALERVAVADTRGFFNLAARVIRCELIDLARHFQGPLGIGANHASVPAGPAADPPAAGDDDLDNWTAFHEAVEDLPVKEREVFGLAFYHGWTQLQIAELFGISDREVRRRWRAACNTLKATLGGRLPAL